MNICIGALTHLSTNRPKRSKSLMSSLSTQLMSFVSMNEHGWHISCTKVHLNQVWPWPKKEHSFKSVKGLNSLRPRQMAAILADDIFKWIFLNENVIISIEISLKSVSKGPINNIPALVQIMAWRRPGDKPLSGSMMVRLPTHICVTRPQWVHRSELISSSLSTHLPNYVSHEQTWPRSFPTVNP